ncbi:GPP34 family phosphoprotein [Nocardia sp. NPDC051570]|uniref:GOLPH3/VPS74 family protein n=1 Tax=Nocardia sp. NPDC051570 TaxID=3364324 RepID=UPI0037A3570A
MLTVAEEFLLLALDDNNGKRLVDNTRLGAALAGAALVELTSEGVLRLTGPDDPGHKPGRLVVTDRRPDDARLAGLLDVVDGRKPKDAVAKVAGFGSWRDRSKDFKQALLADLVDAGYLTEQRGKLLGVFPTTVWKSANPAGEAEIVARVRAAVAGQRLDDRTAALTSILYAVGLLPKVVPDIDKRTVERRGKEISDSGWGGPAVRKAVQEIQATTAVVIVSATVAATTTS